MTSIKYKKFILYYIVVIVFFLIMFIILSFVWTGGSYKIYSFLPFESTMLAYAVFFIFYIISPIIGVLLGYFLGPFFLWVHKKLIGRKMAYYIEEKTVPDQLKFNFSRIFFPTLMSINLAMMVADNTFVQELILTPQTLTSGDLLVIIQTIPALLIITIIISSSLFSPTIFLLDAGIVYTNKEKVKNTTEPIEVRGVGSWYSNFLKGYAGIGTLISLYMIVFEAFTTLGSETSSSQNIALIIGFSIWCLMPLLFSLLSIPVIFILDKTYNKRMLYIQKYTRKLGI
ncbi:MAG: hypothetical protein KAV01_08980, partial [Candidatus Lokiarchaeota archaeon]|nr:hypothetical protein [Candidatus Lokiarchaeota archaeon]